MPFNTSIPELTHHHIPETSAALCLWEAQYPENFHSTKILPLLEFSDISWS